MTNPATPIWPLVDPKDDGIRPAGPQDACFFCLQRVGQSHKRDCVVVKKRIEMRVRVEVASGVYTAIWQFDEPHSWNSSMSEFHKNTGTWCASNFVDECNTDGDSIVWEYDNPLPELVAIIHSDQCLCSRLSFTFVRIVDATPRRATKNAAN